MVNRICVLPNDSMETYHKKGEIKVGYFNPKNYFDEVHIISLFDSEIDEESVKITAGNAKLIIHKFGKVNLSNYRTVEKRFVELIRLINPNVIRSFNPLVQGWLSIKAGKKLGIPVVISLHTNYSQQKDFAKKEGKYLHYLKLWYTSKRIESFVLKNADSVVCVYEFIVPYAKKMGAKNIHVIYNRVDLGQFSPTCKKELNFEKPTIISVGRLIEQKNHLYLVEAIKDLDVNLLLIGDGPNYQSLTDLAENLRIDDRVRIIKRVPNTQLCGYYTSCNIYAQPLEFLGGITIPTLEAMACGLPVIMSKHDKSYFEIIDDAVYFVDNTAESFHDAFKKILANTQLKDELSKKSLESIKRISGTLMEEKEKEMYDNLIHKKSI